jgi:hypothetical protein
VLAAKHGAQHHRAGDSQVGMPQREPEEGHGGEA